MLETISISGLFGLYSYDVSLKNDDNSPVRFITGPNGYGKTTILKLIYALYTGEYNMLFRIPYDSLSFFYYRR